MREEAVFVPHVDRYEPAEGAERSAAAFYDVMRRRRSVREFSARAVSPATIESLVRTAASAPSGANKQPWRFVCVQDAATKRRIRLGAEEEEREFYTKRAPREWLDALAPLGTDPDKQFLEIAPWLIVVFRLVHDDDESQLYYTHESVGIACGLLLAAAQHAGLATLTHTPSPMRFLSEILGRPRHERPYLLVPLGYPADGCRVPAAALRRKPLAQVMTVV
jgi:iodotyrosine deiodinase